MRLGGKNEHDDHFGPPRHAGNPDIPVDADFFGGIVGGGEHRIPLRPHVGSQGSIKNNSPSCAIDLDDTGEPAFLYGFEFFVVARVACVEMMGQATAFVVFHR